MRGIQNNIISQQIWRMIVFSAQKVLSKWVLCSGLLEWEPTYMDPGSIENQSTSEHAFNQEVPLSITFGSTIPIPHPRLIYPLLRGKK